MNVTIVPAPIPERLSEHRKTVRIIANARAGTVLEMGEDRFRTWIEAAFAARGVRAQIDLLTNNEIGQAVAATIADDTADLFVAGGDGTVFRLLPSICEARQPVGLIPLGTVNLLGRDLGLNERLEAAVDAYCSAQSRRVSLGTINGMAFHSNAGIGILGRMARERERARSEFPFSRAVSFAIAALRTLVRTRPFTVTLEFAGGKETVEADAVLVTNNVFDGMPWRRENLDARVLECHILASRGLSNRLSMAWWILRGRWREHPFLRSTLVRQVTISRARRGHMAVAVDGEAFRFSSPLTFQVAEQSVRFYGMTAEPQR